jgi:hypothetical protein
MPKIRTPRPDAQPQAPRQIRSDGWTLPRQRQFLKVLTVTGSVEEACLSAGMSRASAYRLRLHPSGKAFRDAWARALVASVSSIREIAFERAVNGVDEPVWENGKFHGYRKVYNDRLLMFLLKNYDGQSPVARTGHAQGASAWPQEALLNSFDALEPANIPEPEIPYVVDEDAAAMAQYASEEPSTCVNLMTPYGEQAVENTEFRVFAEKK